MFHHEGARCAPSAIASLSVGMQHQLVTGLGHRRLLKLHLRETARTFLSFAINGHDPIGLTGTRAIGKHPPLAVFHHHRIRL